MTKQPTCNDRLATEAYRLGHRMWLLQRAVEAGNAPPQVNEFDEMELIGWHQSLCGIGAVLRLLLSTPGACINAQGLSAMRRQVETASDFQSHGWAAEVLGRVDPMVSVRSVSTSQLTN